MAGQSQAVNLGGMLSQIGNSMGSMGSAGNGLLRPLENTFRPEADPTDITSMKNLMQWQSGMGRSQEAALTGRTIADMEAKQYRAAKDAEAAEAKAQKLRHDKMVMGFRDAYANAKTEEQREQIRRAASMVSQSEGVDMLSGINQIDQMDRAVAAEERARANHEAANKQRDTAEKSQELMTAYMNAGDDEAKAQIRQQLSDINAAGALQTIDDRERRDTQWAQAQEDRDKRKADEAIPAVTEGERGILTETLSVVKDANPRLAEGWRKAIEATENNPILSNELKRQEIDRIRRQAETFNLNNASAAAAAARKANATKIEDLKQAPVTTWDGEDTYWGRRVEELDMGKIVGFFSKETKANEGIDKFGREEVARVAANYAYTFPEMSADAAIEAAIDALGGKFTNPMSKPSSDGEKKESGTQTIVIE